MTVALGLRCDGGAIIAADTQMTDPDHWTTTHGPKVIHFPVESSIFGFAYSSGDVPEAVSMIREIQEELNGKKPTDWNGVRNATVEVMSDFFKSYNFPPPKHSLILAAFLEGLGVELFSCAPPRVFLSKRPEGYVSVGIGGLVADPLHETLFKFALGPRSPQVICRQIAYLMYRVKKEHGAAVGGDTTAYYICEDGRSAEMVRLEDFRRAEKAASQLDALLGMTAETAIGQRGDLKQESDNVAESILMSSMLRDVVFHNLKLEPIQAPSP